MGGSAALPERAPPVRVELVHEGERTRVPALTAPKGYAGRPAVVLAMPMAVRSC